MAKNRNKKKRNASSSAMEISTGHTTVDAPLAMDTSESVTPNPHAGAAIRKTKKGVQMKRSKNVRKMKAIAKAVSLNEKSLTKISKNESKTQRTLSAKKLYD